ncbi:response regulator transcription factor [Nocardioides antri]|uniref:Helix-turn-helix transcriptional regulator n=1 Tax=Nocardioides antri TaxID=2607659 RepID=A0A5B1LUI2_9ACTN|nr:helix-turn-helix transcriptional regulator [Nocardioides antri]KAA1423200.1 helix-turn-helix transcriptional regulator [Nocardioides antri]
MSETQRSSTLATHGVQRRHLKVVHAPQPYRAPATAVAASAPSWAGRLSDREVEVLHCIAAGLSTTEIAQTLFISTATVKSHIARLITKVEVRDRLQLVVAAYRTGFIRLT